MLHAILFTLLVVVVADDIPDDFSNNCPDIMKKCGPNPTQEELDNCISQFINESGNNMNTDFLCFGAISRYKKDYAPSIMEKTEMIWEECDQELFTPQIIDDSLSILRAMAEINDIVQAEISLACITPLFSEDETLLFDGTYVYKGKPDSDNFSCEVDIPILVQKSFYPYFVVFLDDIGQSVTFSSRNMPESDMYYFCTSQPKMIRTSCDVVATSPTLITCKCEPPTDEDDTENERLRAKGVSKLKRKQKLNQNQNNTENPIRQNLAAQVDFTTYYLLANVEKPTPNRIQGLVVSILAGLCGIGVLGGTLLAILLGSSGDEEEEKDDYEGMSEKEKAEAKRKEDEIIASIRNKNRGSINDDVDADEKQPLLDNM